MTDEEGPARVGFSRRYVFRGAGIAAAVGAGLAVAACADNNSSDADHPAPSGSPGSNPGQVTQPATGTDMPAEYAAALGQFAYLWGWALANMRNRHDAIVRAPRPSLLDGVAPAAPQGRLAMLSNYIAPQQTVIACPNQDVVYGLAFLDLDAQPVIVQVPDFGDRFWVYALYDARTDQFGQLGKQYGTAPGFYLLAGPNWHGNTPEGVTAVIRSSTALANAIPRVFMDSTPEDRAAIQPVINRIGIYPLSEFDGTTKTTDWSALPTIPGPPSPDGGETKWVVPEQYFDQLATILDTVPALPGEEALYAQFRSVLAAARRQPDLGQTLIDTAVATENTTIATFLAWKHNGVPAGNGWHRSVNNAQFGIDYLSRTATAKSNMFENRPVETQYYYTDNDATGAPLDGTRSYRVTFPAGQEPPVEGFWSLTLYNDKHFFAPNALDRFSLGTKNKNLVRDPDGALTLYVGDRSPGADRENNWIPAPSGPFSLYIRAYWGRQPILDGTWQPPAITAV